MSRSKNVCYDLLYILKHITYEHYRGFNHGYDIESRRTML